MSESAKFPHWYWCIVMGMLLGTAFGISSKLTAILAAVKALESLPK